MKKLLLTLLFTFPAIASVYAQCTPNPNLPDLITEPAGSRHDTVYNGSTAIPFVVLPPAQVGQNYNEVLYINVPIDTPAFGQTVTINYVQLDSILNLPPGLTVNCNPLNCQFPGGTSGCVSLDGIPQQADSIEMQIAVTVNITFSGLPTPLRDTIGGFYFVSKGYMPVSVNEISEVSKTPKVYPNPANNQVFFDFKANSGSAVLTVTNLLGQAVAEKSIVTQGGINTFTLDVSQLKSGIYLYSIREEGKTFTGRFSISH